jgi:hypothetical protein
MWKIEDILNEAPLQEPSDGLKDRVAHAFRAAKARGRPWFRTPVPLWASAAAALACLGLGYLARAAWTPPPPRAVYVIPAEGALRRFLMGEPEVEGERAPRRTEVTVTTRDGKKL